MRINDILTQAKSDFKIVSNNIADLSIVDIAIDSRLVKKDSAFFAVPGQSKNGSQFIASAIENGANVVIANQVSEFFNSHPDVLFIESNAVFNLLVEFLNIFYPPLPKNIYGVTGTNGKTTTAEFGRQICQFLGKKSASIGTLGVISEAIDQSAIQKSVLTTPDIVSFYKNLSVLKQNDVDDVFIEASSIGMDQKRIAGLDISAGAITNFTQDHLDYHESMDEYFACKTLLFSEFLSQNSVAVINRDIERFDEIANICQQQNHQIFTYGYKDSDFQITSINCFDTYQEITFKYKTKEYFIKLEIIGQFQALNILCALAMVLSKHELSEEELIDLLQNFSQIKAACGRMQKVAVLENKSQIFIDFAHSSDALENVLKLARNITKGRVVVLFGCGGDRDPKKRPIMGKVASDLADLVIVTDDNPRFEDANIVRKGVLSGCDLDKTIEIPGRKDAIKQAITMLEKEDVLILSGKGHEKYQVIGDQRLDFDEERIVKSALS